VKGAAGFKDVTIPCIGTVTGWQPVGGSGKYEVAAVPLVKDRAAVGSCGNGPQSAKSDGAFGITVWGLSTFASYAYPAGGNVSTINTVVVPSGPR
jgi:IgGFc binding protein